MEDLDELTRQLDMLNDLPTEDELMKSLGNTTQPVGVPQTPENPTNVGVVTNSVEPQQIPTSGFAQVLPNTVQQVPMQPQPQGVITTTTGTIPQVMQEQVNAQAQAQAVVQTTTVNPQPVQQSQIMTSQVTPQPVTNLSLFDNDDEEPVFVNIGEVVQEIKVPFVDLKPGEATRVMLFTKAMLTVYTHYIQGIGSIRCLSKRDERGYVVDKDPC